MQRRRRLGSRNPTIIGWLASTGVLLHGTYLQSTPSGALGMDRCGMRRSGRVEFIHPGLMPTSGQVLRGGAGLRSDPLGAGKPDASGWLERMRRTGNRHDRGREQMVRNYLSI